MASLKHNSIIESTLSRSRLRVFHGANALGNIATCFILDRTPSTRWELANARADGETWCLLWKDAQTVRVVALQRGNAIRFCGHGLVAAGYAWLHYCDELPLLRMCERSYRSRAQWRNFVFEPSDNFSRSDGFSIAVPRFDLSPTITDWREHNWFDIAPRCCVQVGKDNGYLLCVWPPGIDIAGIKINFEFIAMQPRAIIMTQSDSENFSKYSERSTDFRFNLRYLAPQYGNDEDAATGSAAAIAANFWQNYFDAPLGKNFIAHQRSRGGGEIHCTVDLNAIWIGGRVTPLRWLQ